MCVMKPHLQTAAEAARLVMQAAGILMCRKWIFLYLLPVSIALHAEADMNQRTAIVPYVKRRQKEGKMISFLFEIWLDFHFNFPWNPRMMFLDVCSFFFSQKQCIVNIWSYQCRFLFFSTFLKWTTVDGLHFLSRALLHSGIWVFPVSRAIAHRLYHVTRKGNLFWFEIEALCWLSRPVLDLCRSPSLLANKLQGIFFYFYWPSSISNTSFPLHSTAQWNHRDSREKTTSPTANYTINCLSDPIWDCSKWSKVFCAVCKRVCVCVHACVCVCVCVLLCEAWRSVLPLSSPISGIETPNCRAPTRLPSEIFLCLFNQALTPYVHTRRWTSLWMHAHKHPQAHHRIQCCWLTLWNIKWKERKSIQLLYWEVE